MTRRLPGFDLEPAQIMAEAEQHGPSFVARVCLFSGGGDSTATLHYALAQGWVDEAAFVDTGTALPGVREHVEQVCADWQVPLTVWEAGTAFEDMVLNPRLGFPGPGQHPRAYQRLKERQLRRLVRIRDHERTLLMEWARSFYGEGGSIARLRDVPPRMHVASIIGHPVRYAVELHKRWVYWTALSGDHWHDFQSLKCYTAEGRRVRRRHLRPRFTSSGGLLSGTAQETGQLVDLDRVYFVAPGVIRQAVKTAIGLVAYGMLLDLQDTGNPWIGFAAWLASVLVVIAMCFLVLNAKHKR